MTSIDSRDDTELETAIQIAEAVSRRAVSAREMVDRVLERIEKSDERLNAFVHVGSEQARTRSP